MQRSSEPRTRPRVARALAVAAALLCASAFSRPNSAYAGPHGDGGGGSHGGGFGGMHGHFAGHDHFGDRAEFAERHRDFDARHVGVGLGLGLGVLPFYYGWNYPYYGYYGYSQPYAPVTWYYCSDPPGYYPYVAQCNTGWQAVPAG